MKTPHLRVALMTNNLIQVDVNFAAAKRVMIYDVNAETSEFVDTCYFGYGSKKGVEMGKKGPGGGKCCQMDEMDDDGTGFDPLTERVNALAGCSLLFTKGLSDLAAYRVHAQKIFPVQTENVHYIDDVIAQVQSLLKMNAPPLWVRRSMREADGSRIVRADAQCA
jgi:nitrogen fixation protein NifX